MFTTYDMSQFGDTLRTLRIQLGVSQAFVSQKTLIHVDTMRKIENGTVIPKYETLEALSNFYKVDLLSILMDKRVDQNAFELYNLIDKFIVSNQIQDLTLLHDKFLKTAENEFHYKFIDTSEIEIIKLFINICRQYYSQNEDFELIEPTIIAYFKKNHNYTEIEQILNMPLNLLEIRLLIIWATLKMEVGHYSLSIIMNKKILSLVTNNPTSYLHPDKICTKLYVNLAYNCHLSDLHFDALTYAKQGIAHSIENSSLYMLHNLYIRKGAAEYLLNDEHYNDSFIKCFHIIEMLDNPQLLSKYKSVLAQNYNLNY